MSDTVACDGCGFEFMKTEITRRLCCCCATERTTSAAAFEECAKLAHGDVTPSGLLLGESWKHGYALGREEAAAAIRANMPKPGDKP